MIGSFLVIGSFFFIVRLAHRVGEQCAFCGGHAIPLKHVSESDRKNILSYFEKVEGRGPSVEYVFVCTDCKRVDDGRLFPGTVIQGHYRCRTCGTSFPIDEAMACDNCGAKYGWVPFEKFGGYQFFLPETEQRKLTV